MFVAFWLKRTTYNRVADLIIPNHHRTFSIMNSSEGGPPFKNTFFNYPPSANNYFFLTNLLYIILS